MALCSFKSLKGLFLLLLFSILMIVSSNVYAAPKSSIPAKTIPAVVERTFLETFGRPITAVESSYWKKRARTDKKTEAALKGAMAFQKAKGATISSTSSGFIKCVVEGKTYIGTKEECALLKELVESNNSFNAKHQAFLDEFDRNTTVLNQQAQNLDSTIRTAGSYDTSAYEKQINKTVTDFNKQAKKDVTKLAKQLDKNRCKPQTGTALPLQCQYGK